MFIIFRNYILSLLLLLVLPVVLASGTHAQAAPARQAQKAFSSPEEAVKGLVQAIRNDDTKELLAILGPGAKEIISSGDPVDDKATRERFVKLFDEKNAIEGSESGRAILVVGSEESRFPIPLVRTAKTWRYDTRAGKEELLNRRIGRNELEVIEVLRAYVDAQRDYAATDWDGDGSWEYARKVRSTPGKRDGLYWATKEGEPESPLGPLAAEASREGYSRESRALHGYYYKILTGQGKDANGGAFDYVVNGKMVLGFAMVAYPARYGSSGIMTFIVNQNGIVYQKNLGKNSARIAAAMKNFNPDKSWKKVE